MDETTDDVAETLFENRSKHPTLCVTLDDKRTFEMTYDGFEYEPVGEYKEGGGYFQQTIEFSEPPEVDIKPDRHATDLGEIAIVETEEGWGTPALHAAVKHVEDGELVRWEYPALGMIATVGEVDYAE